MKFAHFSQIFEREGETAAERYEQLWRELKLAEEVDFDYGFASVHHFSHMRPPTTVFCTGAAVRTSRLRIGTIGYTAAFDDPLRIVEEVAVLDNITHGRLEVGLTAGVTQDEFRIFRGDWDNKYAHATELMSLLKKAFTSEKPFDFEGPFHKYEEVRMSVTPLQKPYPPMWFMTLTPEYMKVAAEEGLNIGYILFRPRQVAAPRVKDYLRMWGEYGHEHVPNIIYLPFIYVDETDDVAVERASPQILHSMEAIYGGELGGGGIALAEVFEKQGRLAEAELRRHMFDAEYLIEQDIAIVGSPETVARKIKAAAEEGLFNVFSGEFNMGTMPEEDLMRSIRLFGTEVIPALRDLDPVKDYLHQLNELPTQAAASE